jgi:hypothetical protein
VGVTNVDPNTLAQMWAQNLASAGSRMQAGAQSVTTSPGQAAAAQQAVWLANLQASANLWAQKVSAVSTQEWQQAFITKGIPRVATGAQAAQSKFATTLGKIIQAEKSIVSSLPARGTLDQNIARSAAFARAMNQQKGSFS